MQLGLLACFRREKMAARAETFTVKIGCIFLSVRDRHMLGLMRDYMEGEKRGRTRMDESGGMGCLCGHSTL